MKLDQELCIGCEQCMPYCPVGALSMGDDEVAVVDRDECVECNNCVRWADCPVDALEQEELAWPRTVRNFMSDVLTITTEARLPGRGTEEMKTNEVTGRFPLGDVGIAIEVGRPGLGTRLYDVEKIAMAVAEMGVTFEAYNPVAGMMEDLTTGKLKEEVRNEKVLSAIIEFSLNLDRLPEMFGILNNVSKEIETVFSLDVATRISPDGSVATDPYIKDANLWLAPNGKTNVGLGRPLATEV